jgi:hypothetical protein
MKAEMMTTTKRVEFKERCYFLYGIQLFGNFIGVLRYHSQGTRDSVSFDPKGMLSKFFLGWFHTHPKGNPLFSERDESTLWAWVTAEGRDFICGVISGSKTKAWVFQRCWLTKDLKCLRIGKIVLGSV